MFSRTTIASSMRMPIASDSPKSDMVFKVKPNTQTLTNEASTLTGSASPVMTVDRQELRNRNTTSTVSSAPWTSASSTLRTARRTRVPASRTISSRASAGSRCRSRATSSATLALTWVVLVPFAFSTSMPTASRPLNCAAVRCSLVPSNTSATSPSSMFRPPREVTTRWPKSAGVSRRPRRRMLRSSCGVFSRPTGAARFCARRALTTWPTLVCAACSASGLSSTASARCSPPTTDTCATPGSERSSRATVGSASRVSAAVDKDSEVRVRETTGWFDGSKRVSTGSSSSTGSFDRTPEMASRMSCEAC